MSAAGLSNFEMERIVSGNGLPPRFYYSPEIFEIEKQEIFAKTWQFAVHESEVSEPRSYAVGRIGDSEVLITRDRDGELHAMRNVCIHRGAQLVDCAGHSAVLRCPYHSWTYGLDGGLRAAPGFEADPRVTAGKSRLSAVRFDKFGPLIFVNLERDASSLADVIGPIDDVAAAWTGLTHQETRRYPYDCNWKIAIENSLECYHCPVVHPGFATLIDTQNYVCEIFEFCASAGGSRRKSANPEGGESMRPLRMKVHQTYRPISSGRICGCSATPVQPTWLSRAGFPTGSIAHTANAVSISAMISRMRSGATSWTMSISYRGRISRSAPMFTETSGQVPLSTVS